MDFNEEKMNKKINSKIQNGYSLETGNLIDESINTFKKTFLMSGVMMIILGIISVIIYGAVFGILYGFSDITTTLSNIESNKFNTLTLLTTIMLSTITSGIFAPINAGFIHANHLARRNEDISMNVFFEFYKSKFFKDIFLAYLLIGFTIGILNVGLILLELNYLSYLIQFLIGLLTVFTTPLIIYGNQNFENALIKSIKLFFKQPLLIFVALLLAIIGVLIGIIALCIGIFFTLPYYYSMIYAIYNQAIGFEEKSIIEEIGQTEI